MLSPPSLFDDWHPFNVPLLFLFQVGLPLAPPHTLLLSDCYFQHFPQSFGELGCFGEEGGFKKSSSLPIVIYLTLQGLAYFMLQGLTMGT